MKCDTQIAVPHAILLISDRIIGATPTTITDELVIATESCLAVGTCPAVDGETRVVLTDETARGSESRLAFRGTLPCPSRQLHIFTTDLTSILQIAVPQPICAVDIWVDDATCPSTVRVHTAPIPK